MQTTGHAYQTTRLNSVEYEIGVRGIREPKGVPTGEWLIGKKKARAQINKEVEERCGKNADDRAVSDCEGAPSPAKKKQLQR